MQYVTWRSARFPPNGSSKEAPETNIEGIGCGWRSLLSAVLVSVSASMTCVIAGQMPPLMLPHNFQVILQSLRLL